MSVLVDDVLIIAKAISFLPDSQITFTDADLLISLNKVLLESIYPSLISSKQGYFVESYDATISSTLKLQIPPRSLNMGVDAIEENDKQLSFVPFNQFNDESYVRAFTIMGNKLKFSSDMEGLNVIITFTSAPMAPVILSSCRQINNIVGNKMFIEGTQNFVASSYSIVDTVGDVIQDTVTKASSTTTTLTASSLNSDVIVGNYICPYLSSCYLAIPPSYSTALAQLMAQDIFQSIGDFESAKANLEIATQTIQNIQKLSGNRAEGKQLKVRQGLFGGRR